jgi:hypothetical protein
MVWMLGNLFSRLMAGTFLVFTALPGSAQALDRVSMRRDLQDWSLAAIDRRLGPDYSAFRSNAPAENFPTIWEAPSRQDAIGRRYQYGGPWVLDPGLYSSTQGQILYAPDAGQFGVDRVNILEWSNGCFTERPEPPWWGGFRPEPAAQKWRAATGGNPGKPVAMSRAMGGWANCGVVAFSSGYISIAGTSTATGTNSNWQLPPGKVATAVAITSKSEFALVALTDLKTHRGQVAVFALQNGGESYFVHDWIEKFPCLPGTGWISDMKLLGYIDLPGIEFPTAIAAAGNDVNRWVYGPNGHVGMLNMWDLNQQATRDSFRSGQNAGYASTAGFCVVISRHEQRAAFIDLQPLLKRVHDLYFTTPEKFARTRNLGPGPTQWPYTFDADPAMKPKLVRVIDVPEPTSVVAGLARNAKARAYIASLDGTVRAYRLGGLATDAAAAPEQISVASQTRLGRNPTCLTPQKGVTDTIIAVSRGDREIAWVKEEASGLRVTRRLRDSRLVDPVAAEMSDTHGIEAPVITVTDFRGRKVVNYRFGRLVFELQGGAIFGMGPLGTDEFECGGTLEVPGSPFCVSATNLN